MREIRDVDVERLEPNPFRDGGSGSATWESVAEAYGFNEEKLKELEASYATNGPWVGLVVRQRSDGPYELAFGHHRVEAARRMGLPKLPVVVENLSDAQMLNMMASENSEEYGHDFALGVMNAVEAVVKAYGSGRIELERVADEAKGRSSSINGKLYSPLTVAKYLGWISKGKAADKVSTSLQALELIELGALRRSQLKGLGSGQARELVTLTKRKMEAEAAKADAQRAAIAKAAEAAAKAADKPKLERLERELEKVDAKAKEHVVSAGRAAAATVQQYFKESRSMAPAIERAAAELGVEKKAKPAAALPKKVDLEAVDRFAARLDALLLEDDGSWLRILEMAGETRAKKAFFNLAESLHNLSLRAKKRATEIARRVS